MANFWDKLLGDDEHAASYMETYGEGIGAQTRIEVGSFINDGESLLDVGCGPGWNMDTFAEYGPQLKRYKGVDYSERFVRVANERRKGQFSTEYALPFELQDQRDLKEPDGSWDAVLLQDCLEHTNGYETPVKEALRVARKRVIITFWHLTDSDSPHINDDGDDGYGAWYDKREWEKFLDSLDLHWLHHQFFFPASRQRDLYVIDKEVQHGD
jgi:ubiquinone/menaquinone biosynthesis C-methylase UbiE